MQCPICKSDDTEQSLGTGYNTMFDCPQCGGYFLSARVLWELAYGKLAVDNIAAFRRLVAEKKGSSTEFPIISFADLHGLPPTWPIAFHTALNACGHSTPQPAKD